MKTYRVTRLTDGASRKFFNWDKPAMIWCIKETIRYWGRENLKVEVVR